MAATVQSIHTPKRYRAQDTSSSYQKIDPTNYIVNGTFDSDLSNWTVVGGGVAQSSGKCVWTTIADTNQAIYTDLWAADSENGQYVMLKYEIVANANNVVLYSGGYSPGAGIFNNRITLPNTVGTHTVINRVRTDNAGNANRLYLFTHHPTGSHTLEVDNIELYRVENFGNNNHGQMYSGKALDFDGVSDYLVGPSTEALGLSTSWTAALWFKSDTLSTAYLLNFFDDTSDGIGLETTSDHLRILDDIDGGDDPYYSYSIEANIWYRAVMIMDNYELKLYVNGKLVGSGLNQGSVGGTGPSGLETAPFITYIGQRGTTTPLHFFDGKMSDVQVWDSAWTTKEAEFDYANPEKLALRSSGSSLTESNLRLWYPMNDANTAQEAVIGDASNTGPVKERVLDGQFSEDVVVDIDNTTETTTAMNREKTGTYWAISKHAEIKGGIGTIRLTYTNHGHIIDETKSAATGTVTLDTRGSNASANYFDTQHIYAGPTAKEATLVGYSTSTNGTDEITFAPTGLGGGSFAAGGLQRDVTSGERIFFDDSSIGYSGNNWCIWQDNVFSSNREDIYEITFDVRQTVGLETNDTFQVGNDYSKLFTANATESEYVSGGSTVEQSNPDNPNHTWRTGPGLTSEWQTITVPYHQNWNRIDVGNDGLAFGADFYSTDPSPGQTSEFQVRNISVKLVNQKNHATSEFVGEELIPDANDRTEFGTNNWKSASVNGSNTDNDFDSFTIVNTGADETTYPNHFPGDYIKIVTASDLTNKQWCYLDGGNTGGDWEADMVEGEMYRLSWRMEIDSIASGTLTVGTSNDGNPVLPNHYSTYTDPTGPYWYKKDFVYMPASDERIVIFADTGTAFTAYFDGFTLKRIGTATGWTDADQQLDIAQLPLQSYNQLGVGLGDDILTNSFGVKKVGVASDTFMGLTEGSVSAWIKIDKKESCTLWHMNEQGEGSTYYLRSYYAATTNRIDLIQEKNDIAQFSHHIDLDNTHPGDSYLGKWIHIVWSNDNTTSNPHFYVNGEYIKATAIITTDMSGWTDFTVDGNINELAVQAGGWSNVMGGCMTEISCWDKQLTGLEVQELYNKGKAKDALLHSASANLKGYWRNLGLRNWTNLYSPGINTLHAQNPSAGATMIQVEGVDKERDSQGFLMSKHKDTSALNPYYIDVGAAGDSNGVEVKNSPSLDITGSFTLACWAKFNSFDQSWNLIQKKAAWNTIGYGMYVHAANKNLFIEYANGSGNQQTNSGVNTVDETDVWYYLAVVHDDGVKDYMYYAKTTEASLNATETATYPLGGVLIGVSTNDLPLTVGSSTGGADGYPYRRIDGQIDEAKVYSRALTATELARNFKAGKRSHR